MFNPRSAAFTFACREASTRVLATGRPPTCGDALSEVLGRRLRWLRVERRWRREEVAKRVRVPVEHVDGHERGTRRIEPRHLTAYARLFRVRISDFFKDPPTQGNP